jgi:hypothetical protein
VRNCVPNIDTVGGGTPRRVHSRANAAIARGCARKKAGSFLTLLHTLDRQADLLLHLIVRHAVEVGHARVDIEHRRNLAECPLDRRLLVVDERLRQFAFVARATGDIDGRITAHAVDAKGARFDRRPGQQAHEPSGRSRRKLWWCLGGVCELAGRSIAERMAET